MKQMYSSAETSINKDKLPAIYGKLHKLGGLESMGKVLDYGCGKYFDNYNLGKNVFGYDAFNYIKPENLTSDYDYVLCSNVLNVIAESEIRHNILVEMKNQGKKVLITIYSGNNSKIGKVSKKDCWQENRPLKDYREELEKVFSCVTFKYGMAICE